MVQGSGLTRPGSYQVKRGWIYQENGRLRFVQFWHVHLPICTGSFARLRVRYCFMNVLDTLSQLFETTHPWMDANNAMNGTHASASWLCLWNFTIPGGIFIVEDPAVRAAEAREHAQTYSSETLGFKSDNSYRRWMNLPHFTGHPCKIPCKSRPEVTSWGCLISV